MATFPSSKPQVNDYIFARLMCHGNHFKLYFAAHRQGDQHGVRVPATAGQGKDGGGGGSDPGPELGK